MEERNERKVAIYVSCPKCRTQLKVEAVFVTEVPEQPAPKEPEAKPDGDKGKTEGTGSDPAESQPVRPADEAAGTSEAGPDPPAADPKPGKRAKKPGGK